MKKILSIVLFFNLSFSYASSYKIESGEITYNVHFLLKHVEATSTKIKGKGVCKKKKCDFIIATPVKSFVSKDSNRDSKMLLFTKASVNPMVVVKTGLPAEILKNKVADLEISFAGKSKLYREVPVKITSSKNGFKVVGKVGLKLSDFAIERPSLLGVEIKDVVPIDVDLNWVEI